MIRQVLLGLSVLLPIAAGASLLGASRTRRAAPSLFLATFIVHMALLKAVLTPRNRWLGPVIDRFSPADHEIWLTLDDGPDPEDTPVILDLLRQAGARATFFVIGEKARRHPELIRRILEEGHGIGNHTMTHPQGRFWRLGPREIAREIDDAAAILQQITGETPHLFRAPAGHTPPTLQPALGQRGLILCAWSARGFDTACRDAEKVLARITRQLESGAIVLLHEGVRDESGRRISPEIVRRFLAHADAAGYRCVIPKQL